MEGRVPPPPGTGPSPGPGHRPRASPPVPGHRRRPLGIAPGIAAAMEPAEAEFLAEKEMVTIVPNFSLDRIHLIGVGGPGVAGRGGSRGPCGRSLGIGDGRGGRDWKAGIEAQWLETWRAELEGRLGDR